MDPLGLSTATKRKNRIAWLCTVQLASEQAPRPIYETVNAIAKALDVPHNDELTRFVTATIDAVTQQVYQDSDRIISVRAVDEDWRDDFAWKLLVIRCFKRGITIGEINKGKAVDEATKIGISTEEMLLFQEQLATAVLCKTYS